MWIKNIRRVAFGAAAIAGCGDSSNGAVSRGHSLQLDVRLVADDAGEVAFLSPSNTVTKYAAAAIVGKPFLVASFDAGFTPGSDPPRDHLWGTVPADLTVHYATPATYSDGPYDVVFVVYTNTAITSAIESGPAQDAPAAKGGDLASFSLDESVVLPGDPTNALGTIRFNVKGGDTEVALANRTPADASSSADVSAAFDDTVLTIP